LDDFDNDDDDDDLFNEGGGVGEEEKDKVEERLSSNKKKLNGLTVAQLREALQKRGAESTGLKKALTDRLSKIISQEEDRAKGREVEEGERGEIEGEGEKRGGQDDEEEKEAAGDNAIGDAAEDDKEGDRGGDTEGVGRRGQGGRGGSGAADNDGHHDDDDIEGTDDDDSQLVAPLKNLLSALNPADNANLRDARLTVGLVVTALTATLHDTRVVNGGMGGNQNNIMGVFAELLNSIVSNVSDPGEAARVLEVGDAHNAALISSAFHCTLSGARLPSGPLSAIHDTIEEHADIEALRRDRDRELTNLRRFAQAYDAGGIQRMATFAARFEDADEDLDEDPVFEGLAVLLVQNGVGLDEMVGRVRVV
jgi:hypothetical protein